MATIKRSESHMPLAASDRSRRQSFINFSAPGHHHIIGFPQFPYDSALGPFNLPRMGAQSPTESDHPAIYSHPSASYHLNPTTQSGFSSPASTHSSPNPYGDFNAFPLSPSNTGATLASLITQPQNSSHGHLAHLPHQPSLPFDLSSTISSPTSCEISHSCELPLNRHARRDSYSTTLDDPSYERRHSTVSVGSIRSLHSSSPYTNYTSLETTPGAQSQIYTLTGDLSSQGVFYMDSGHHAAPHSSELTGSNFIQPGLMSDVPRLTQSPISHVNGSLPIQAQIQPGKNTTRQYRKKTPPDCCAVCGVKQTPEWRKGPSGLRTLCNACGLTAAKHSLQAPTSIEEVWAQLHEIGISRFRRGYELDEQKKAAAARNWSSQSQPTGRTSNDRPHYKTSSTPSPTNTAASLSMSSVNENHPPPTGRFPHQLSSPLCDSSGQMLDFYAHTANGMNPQDSRLNSIGGHRMSISSIVNQDPPAQSQSCFNNNAPVPPFHQQHQSQSLHHQFFLQSS